MHGFIEIHAKWCLLHGDVRVAPSEENHGVDEQGEQEIEQYAAHHDEQSLPCGLGAKLPWLHGLFHLFGIHRLVYHTSNFNVSAQR